VKVKAMEKDELVPISVTALRAVGYSADGKDVILSLTTKYSTAERTYSVPVECFSDLIADLKRLGRVDKFEPVTG